MFLKIGKRYLNTDHITDVLANSKGIQVFFAGDHPETGDTILTGEYAAALLKYLDLIAMNLTPEVAEVEPKTY